MDILCLSDLHFELHRDGGAEFLSRLKTQAEVLILAGDICAGWQMPTVMEVFCKKAASVVYVHGNHEFYGSDRADVLKSIKKASRKNRNLHWLDCDTVEIGGVRFHGTPLWFKEAPLAPKHELNDFSQIHDYEDWVYKEHDRAVEFLSENVEEGDVVVTHYLPSRGSVSAQFARSPLNPFFLSDMEGLIRVRQPALWFHGHTHSSFDYKIGETRVVCNPHGYGTENAKKFSTKKVIRL